jgi:hypothetical protein
LSIPAGQFPEPAEENLLQEIQRLQFTRTEPGVLTAARSDALTYLNSAAVREWFASHDLSSRRDEGVQWIESTTADDLRVAARDLLIMNRVIASWSPKAKQIGVAVESLTPAPLAASLPAPVKTDTRPGGPDSESDIVTFPSHTDASPSTMAAERLASGVSVVMSNVTAVFVSGGPLTRFDHEPTMDDVKAFQKYRPDRLLVLVPAASMDRARQLWNSFKGTLNGEIGVPKGNVSSGDLPALLVLKTILDLKVINAGWRRDVELRIDASEGSALQIHADNDRRTQILQWIKGLAATPPSESYFNWTREVAVHHFNSVSSDLQALTWERDPQGTVQDIRFVSEKQVQDVAQIYF